MDKYKWKYRILLVETPDYDNKSYKDIDKLYNENIKELHKRYVKKIVKIRNNFTVKLIGFDGTEKFK